MILNPLTFQVCKGLLFISLSVTIIILNFLRPVLKEDFLSVSCFLTIILEIYNFSHILPSVFLFPFNWTSISHILKRRKSHFFFSFSLHFLLKYNIYHSFFFSSSYSSFLFIFCKPSSRCLPPHADTPHWNLCSCSGHFSLFITTPFLLACFHFPLCTPVCSHSL